MNKKIILKNTNENSMVSEIELNNFKTNVRFGFNPDNVEYLGKLDKKTFKKII